MANTALVSHLRLISMLMSLDGEDFFKVRAFKNAADTIEMSSEDVTGQNALTFPGVGLSIKAVIDQFLTQGTSSRMLELAKRWPVSALTMTRVEGIGPKTAMKFHKEGIRTLTELVAAAKAGKILNSRLRNAILATEGSGRISYSIAIDVSRWVSEQMTPHVERSQVCGSLRRFSATVKDIDLVAQNSSERAANAAMVAFCSLGEHVRSGPRRATIKVSFKDIVIGCDIWLCEPSTWGSHLNHVTGSKDHNVRLRTLAREQGMLINEYGIFRGSERLGGDDEGDIYRLLDIPYAQPYERQG